MATSLALALEDEAAPSDSALQELRPLAMALADAVALALAVTVVY